MNMYTEPHRAKVPSRSVVLVWLIGLDFYIHNIYVCMYVYIRMPVYKSTIYMCGCMLCMTSPDKSTTTLRCARVADWAEFLYT